MDVIVGAGRKGGNLFLAVSVPYNNQLITEKIPVPFFSRLRIGSAAVKLREWSQLW